MKLSTKLSMKSGLLLLACCAMLVLTGCKKSSSQNYNVKVNVSGLIGTGLVMQLNLAYNLAVTGNGVFTFSQQLPNNTAYSVSILTPPGGPFQNCALNGATGTTSGADVTDINVVCAPVEFAYLTNSAANSVAPYVIDLLAGGLTSAGQPTPIGSSPVAFTVSPSGRYAYALNQADKTVSSFLANSSTGYLLSAGSATSTGTVSAPAMTPAALAVDPSNQYVYVADNGANSISGFTINSASAALTCIGNNGGSCPSPVASNISAPTAMTMTQSGSAEYLFVASASGQVFEYAVNSGGTLSAVGSAATGNGPQAIAATPGTGAYVYVVNATDGSVSGYANNAGVLASTGAAVMTNGSSPRAIAINPTGTFAYVVNAGSNSMTVFSISSIGALTAIGTSATGSNPVSVSVDPKGKYVYVANQGDGTVYVYTIGADGTTGTGQSYPLGNSPVSIVTVAAN